jgi:tRNA G10  N-methylase Trm11
MIVNKGDIFKVGEHIIGCGDSTDSNFVSQVIGNKKIRAVISDPPYGVDYGANTKQLVKKITNDQ